MVQDEADPEWMGEVVEARAVQDESKMTINIQPTILFIITNHSN